ncbi:hypothetical protein KJ891_04510 [Candidatus Micrarchaeota archaeon]|nr:hypothetical protein [Candidatus Micrarchaeota archaeon]
MRLPLNERYIKYCGEHGIDKRYFESAKEYFMKYGTAGEAANAAFKHIHDVYSKGEVWYTDSQITARTNARNHSNMVERFYKLFLKDPQMVRLKATGGKE